MCAQLQAEQDRVRLHASFITALVLTFCAIHSEQQALVKRYEGWQHMRQVAAKNAGGALPEELAKQADYPPPPPPPVDESDFPDPSVELSHAALEADALDFAIQGTGFTSEGPVLGLAPQDGYQNQPSAAAQVSLAMIPLRMIATTNWFDRSFSTRKRMEVPRLLLRPLTFGERVPCLVREPLSAFQT